MPLRYSRRNLVLGTLQPGETKSPSVGKAGYCSDRRNERDAELAQEAR